VTRGLEIKASQAKELLHSDAYRDAMRKVKDAQIEAFLSSAQDDVETRNKAHSIILALSAIEYELVNVVTDQEMLDRKKRNKRD
tara:strand:+ start:104 stop:355 length:252 start_codon:yes stop_codon:yes gene_type:complete